jgi:hypothetical protein
MNYKLVQRQLDIAAEELEKKGHSDLSDKIDTCNAKLEKATAEERRVIAGVLQKIDREADRREASKKPKGRINPRQVAAHRRRDASRERIRERLAARKLERELLADLNLGEEAEADEDATLHQGRKDRIKAAKIEALKREQERLEAE